MVTLITRQRNLGKCLVSLVLGLFVSFGQGRLRPPDNVGCERNDLTSYTGVMTEFSRSKTHVLLVIRTDADTIERVNVPNDRIGDRALKNGDRLTAWVCKSGAVTIQWLN